MTTNTVPTGHFSLRIGGKQRTGKLDMEALCTIETELNNLSLMGALGNPTLWGFNVTVTVLWIGLARMNEQISKKHVQLWIQTAVDEGTDLMTFMQAAQSAVLCALGSRVRTGVGKFNESGELPDVDGPAAKEGEGDDGEARPLARVGASSRSA